MENLNDKQKEAAIHQDGPLLIVAGAGAGKTKTITHRIVNLIKNGIAPEKILAVTFTNKAAKEMRDRILKAIGKNLPLANFGPHEIPFISTFHALGVYIIKENARTLGLTRYFSILDEGQAITIIKDIIKDNLNLDPKKYGVKVNLTYVELDEQLYAKFRINEGDGYDVINISDFMVQILARQGYLQTLDHKAIPNLECINQCFLNQIYDPDNRYSVPHKWFMYGIVYDKTFFNCPPEQIDLGFVFKNPQEIVNQGIAKFSYKI